MVDSYVPEQGDIISLQFNPQAGREQAGRRPALVLSPTSYNSKVGLLLCVPITKQQKGYPFEVPSPSSCKTQGVILADHVKNLDWNARHAQFIEKAPATCLKDVLQKTHLLLEIDH